MSLKALPKTTRWPGQNLGLILSLPKFRAFSTTVGGIANINCKIRFLRQRNRRNMYLLLPVR